MHMRLCHDCGKYVHPKAMRTQLRTNAQGHIVNAQVCDACTNGHRPKPPKQSVAKPS